jgi:hypothetical protein
MGQHQHSFSIVQAASDTLCVTGYEKTVEQFLYGCHVLLCLRVKTCNWMWKTSLVLCAEKRSEKVKWRLTIVNKDKVIIHE